MSSSGLSRFVLHHSPDKYFVEATSSLSPTTSNANDTDKILILDRVSHELILTDGPLTDYIPSITSRENIAGILGIIQLGAGPYLVLIKEAEKLGDISSGNDAVFRITSTQILPFSRTDHHLTTNQQEENKAFLSMLQNQFLSTPYFYFSYTADLTRNLQQLQQQRQRQQQQQQNQQQQLQQPEQPQPQLHQQQQQPQPSDHLLLFTDWDDRFVWNKHLLERFLESGAEFLRYCVPVIHGALFIRQCSLNGKLFRYVLCSRRSNRRAGTRFNVRGIDEDGNCANFVETEQRVEHAGSSASFVQTRGSIPIFWAQIPSIVEYKPGTNWSMAKPECNLKAFTRHISEQLRFYEELTMVSLIDQKYGPRKAEDPLNLIRPYDEGHLSKMFHVYHSDYVRTQGKGFDNVDLVSFDFHKECSKLRWHRLKGLTDQLSKARQRYAYFLETPEGVIQRQLGVFRTNCMDCLDRTNVAQSLLARENLQDVLSHLGILRDGQALAPSAPSAPPTAPSAAPQLDHFQTVFRNVWADNGDVLSAGYAGTGALKTDFTRTGKRTVKGMLNDLVNTVVRYYKNNFTDGYRQDAIDLFLGNYCVNTTGGGLSPYADLSQTTSWLSYLPLALLICVSMLVLPVLFMPDIEDGIGVLIYFVFWILSTFGVSALIYAHARDLVNKPKLARPALEEKERKREKEFREAYPLPERTGVGSVF